MQHGSRSLYRCPIIQSVGGREEGGLSFATLIQLEVLYQSEWLNVDAYSMTATLSSATIEPQSSASIRAGSARGTLHTASYVVSRLLPLVGKHATLLEAQAQVTVT